jgi:anti-anti-sigma factor
MTDSRRIHQYVRDWGIMLESIPVLKIDIHDSEDVAVVRCTGRVVHGEEAESLQRTVLSVKERHIVIDLSRVTEIDAAGAGVLAALQRWAIDSKRTIRLLNPNHRLRRVLKLTGLDLVLEVSSQPPRAYRRSA